jgi:hypothetical protein
MPSDAASAIELIIVFIGGGLFLGLLCLIDISFALRRIDKRLQAVSSALLPPKTIPSASKLSQFVAHDDGGGRVLHAEPGAMPFHTYFESDGYYSQRLTGAPRGPFPTREGAKADQELRSNR